MVDRAPKLPAYMSEISSCSSRGTARGRTLVGSGTASSITERVEVLDRVSMGKAPRAKRLLRAEERDVDKKRGTTKVLPAGFGDGAELFDLWFDLQSREMPLTALCRSSLLGGKSDAWAS